jgi:uncharacterized protein (TIGR02594 family)
MLPTQYAWLANEPAPKVLVEGVRTYGVAEIPGPMHSAEIMGWAREVGLEKVYTADEIAWCGLWLAVIAKRAGKPVPAAPLWARNWAAWGTASPSAALGDVLVFSRGAGGHVGLYVGEDDTAFHCLGGNTRDCVSIARIAKARLIAARRHYSIGVPANVRQVRMSSVGALSTNEA